MRFYPGPTMLMRTELQFWRYFSRPELYNSDDMFSLQGGHSRLTNLKVFISKVLCVLSDKVNSV